MKKLIALLMVLFTPCLALAEATPTDMAAPATLPEGLQFTATVTMVYELR